MRRGKVPSLPGGIAGVTLEALLICALTAGTALAQTSTSQGSVTTTTLNQQQLQAVSVPPVSGDCAGAVTAPAPVQQPQTTVGAGVVSTCAGAYTQQPLSPAWVLSAGEPIGQQLVDWGRSVGWRVVWRDNDDWIVPNSVQFQGDFISVVSEVLQDLSAQGAPVHGIFYQGNHTLIITGDNQ